MYFYYLSFKYITMAMAPTSSSYVSFKRKRDENMTSMPTEVLGTVLSLPKHLQETFLALSSLGVADASQVAFLTHKARAIVSTYLNTLILIRHNSHVLVLSHREGRRKMFQVNPKIMRNLNGK